MKYYRLVKMYFGKPTEKENKGAVDLDREPVLKLILMPTLARAKELGKWAPSLIVWKLQ